MTLIETYRALVAQSVITSDPAQSVAASRFSQIIESFVGFLSACGSGTGAAAFQRYCAASSRLRRACIFSAPSGAARPC